MEIYILRHGEAEPRTAGLKEAERALTPKGKQDVRAVLKAARKALEVPQAIVTSPLLRAQQTAALVAKAFPKVPVIETKQLLPAAHADALWKELGTLKDAEAVLLTGHEPQLSHFIQFLLEAPVAVDLKKGALVRITTQNHVGPPRGVLKWMFTPRLAR